MNEELMRQNLENNRYQSSGIVDNIVTMGIANPLLENTVRNSLAKESSAAFQMALHNGGIYQNNTFFGGNGLYGLFRKVTPKSLRSGQNANYGSIGPFQFNKFSAGSIDAKEGTNLSNLAQNIADNNPNWNIEDDVVATGIGFQKKGYKEFFNQLSDDGFELKKSLSKTVNVSKDKIKAFSSKENLKEYIKENVYGKNKEKIQKLRKTLREHKDFSSWKEINQESSLEEIQRFFEKNGDMDEVVKNAKDEISALHSNMKEEEQKIIREYKQYKKNFMNSNWDSKNLSDDFYDFFTSNYKKVVNNGFDATNADDVKKFNSFMDDFVKLQTNFSKFGKSKSQIDKAIRAYVKSSRGKETAISLMKKGLTYNQAKEQIAMNFVKEHFEAFAKNFSDEVGFHFASKTGFQKLMGNNATRFLTGVQAGMSSFLWQLPLMVVSTTASINQENAIQNFVSSYLYNPKIKEMYNNEATNRSMQISQNIHYSNLQDTQNIIIKHNTAERYLNDLDPINIDLDYSQKSFDLNPRNE